MTRGPKLVLIAVCLFLSLVVTPTPARLRAYQSNRPSLPETIQGRVLDAGGQPIFGAKVHLLRVDANPSGKVRYAVSNENGEFLIEAPAPGEYEVYASKEEEGYPDTMSAFHYAGLVTVPQVYGVFAWQGGNINRPREGRLNRQARRGRAANPHARRYTTSHLHNRHRTRWKI